MKILVCTSYRKEIEYFAIHTSVNKKIYCDLNGYDFIEAKGVQDRTRPFYWDKLKIIQQNINNYNWLMWMDADAVITNINIQIEKYIDSDYDLIIAREDINNYLLNTGIFLIKNSEWSKKFLDKWYSQAQFTNVGFHEQSALVHIYNYEKEVRDHIKVIKQKSFNSFPQRWSEGDFIVHFAGISNRSPLIDISYGDFKYLYDLQTVQKLYIIIPAGILILGYIIYNKNKRNIGITQN